MQLWSWRNWGVVRRVFRTLCINGQQVPNVLFLDLDVDTLLALTYPAEEISGETVSEEKYGRYPTQISGRVPQESGGPPTETSGTNTEITSVDYNRDYPILSYQEVEERFKAQIEYGILKHDYPDDERLDEMVRIAVDVLTSGAETIRVNKEERNVEQVKAQFYKLNLFHMQYVLNALGQNERKAHNIRAVMITSLYNAVNTLGNYYGNLVQYQTANHEGQIFKDAGSIRFNPFICLYYGMFTLTGLKNTVISLFLFLIIGGVVIYRGSAAGDQMDEERNFEYSQKGTYGTAGYMTKEERAKVLAVDKD